MIRRVLLLLWLALLPVLAPALALADCRLALVLALDVSSSVDPREDALQRQGMAAALLAPEVQRGFFATPQPVALAVFEWSGRENQDLLLDWTMIDSPATLLDAAETLARSQRGTREYPTAIGHALGYGARLLTRAPHCHYSTIDLSGDGENNEGFGPRHAYDAFPFQGVVVNGLAIVASGSSPDGKILEHYQNEVLHGPAAFLEIAEGFGDYERAMRRKLERELRPMMIGAASE